MRKLLILICFFVSFSLFAELPVTNVLVNVYTKKGAVSITYNLGPQDRNLAYTIRVFYAPAVDAPYTDITAECIGAVGPNVTPGLAKEIIWETLKYRESMNDYKGHVKLEAIYAAASDNYIFAFATPPPAPTNPPQEVLLVNNMRLTPIRVTRQQGTHRLQFITRLTNQGARRYVEGGSVNVTLVTSTGEQLSRSGFFVKYSNNQPAADWLNASSYLDLYANIDFGNITVDRVISATIEFQPQLNFLALNFSLTL